MGLTVGIDLGTTYSVISYIDHETNTPKIIKNKLGFTTTPSVVCFDFRGNIKIGEEAKTELEMGNPHTASFYKLEMGHPDFSIQLAGKNLTAMDLSAAFLRELVRQAEETVAQPIENAVITVPAYFEDPERNSTMLAAAFAGLNVLGIINEPTAAAIAYGIRNQSGLRNILIYDLGGGTFDVTVAEVTETEIVVKGSAGKHFLGGKNWDEAIVKWVAEQFEEEFCESFVEDKDAFNACMVKAEKAKRTLSTAPYADISFEYEGNTGRYRLTNEIFKDCTSDLLNITKNTIDYLLRDISLTWKDIDGVILVGGSTKMKMVSEYIQEMTGKMPLGGVHPDEAVAIGAAIHAESLIRKKQKRYLAGSRDVKDVMAHSLGMISISEDGSKFVNDIMIKRNTPLSEASVKKLRELKVSTDEAKNELEIYLLQGDMECPIDCTIAKKYVFSNISYVEGGVTYVEIRYYYTENGTIAIEAKQTETGRTLSVREEAVPSDMSWVTLPPDEVFPPEKPKLQGAIYMALDVSGSMYGYPLETAKKAMLNFARKFENQNIDIGIIAFADKIKIHTEATSDQKVIRRAINSLQVGLGGGNEAQPFDVMYERMRQYKDAPFIYALVLTDGRWDSAPCRRSREVKKMFVNNGFQIIALGFGTADEKFLRDISTRQDFAAVEDVSKLDEKLLKIARIIQSQ